MLALKIRFISSVSRRVRLALTTLIKIQKSNRPLVLTRPSVRCFFHSETGVSADRSTIQAAGTITDLDGSLSKMTMGSSLRIRIRRRKYGNELVNRLTPYRTRSIPRVYPLIPQSLCYYYSSTS